MATTVTHFRARNDDGTETTATWKATEDQPWVQATDVNFRFRSKIQNDTTAINNLDVQLQYSLNGAAFTNVTASSSVIRSSASPNVADAANTTAQLTAGTGTFIGATAFDEVNGICGGTALDLTATGNMEVEFCVQLRSADVVIGDKVGLRTINSDTGTPWTTYNVTAEMWVISRVLTVSKTLGTLTLSASSIVENPHLVTDVSILSASNESGGLYGSFDRTAAANAALDKTLGVLALSGISTAAIQPALSKTLGSLSLAATAAVAIQPAVTKTLGAVTLAGIARLEAQAIVSKTLGSLSLAGISSVAVQPSVAKTLGTLTLSGIASVGGGIQAALSKTLGVLGSSAAVTVHAQASTVKTLGALTSAGVAIAAATVNLTKTLGALTLTAHAAGQPTANAAVDKTLGSMTGSGIATATIAAAVTKTLGSLSLSGAATSPRTASLNRFLGNLSLSASAGGPIRSSVSMLSPLSLPIRFYGVFDHAPATLPNLTAAVNTVLGPTTIGAAAQSDARVAVTKTLGGLGLSASVVTVTGGRAVADFSTHTLNSEPGRLYGDFTKAAGLITASLTKTLGTLTFGPPGQLLLESGGGLLLESGGALLLEQGKAIAEVRVAGSLTKTLGALTCAGIANARVNANFARTLGPLGHAVGAQVLNQVAVAKTLGALTSNASAVHGVGAVVAVDTILGALTSSGAVVAITSASLSRTLGTVTSAGVIRPIASTVVSKALAALALASDADVLISTAVSKILGPLTLTANVVSVPGRVLALTRTLGPLAVSSALTNNISSSLVKTLGSLTGTLSTRVELRATLAKGLGPLTVSGYAQVAYSAAVNQTLKALILAGEVKNEIHSAVNETLGALTLSSPVVSDRNAALNVMLGPLIANERLAALAITLGALDLTGAARGLGEPAIIVSVEGEMCRVLSVEGEMCRVVSVEGNLVTTVSEDLAMNAQVGAIGVSLEYTVKAIDPVDGKLKPVDLATAIGLKILLQKPQGRTTTEYPAELKTTGIDGIIRYVTQSANDLDRSGTWLIQPRFILGGFNGTVEKQFFYVERNLVVQP